MTQAQEREEIHARIRVLQTRLAQAARRFDRSPQLLAVTKNHPAERINLLDGTGLTDIAESRVQEWREKSPQICPEFALHWIGRLQTNKVKYIIEKVCLIHSLDRPSLAEEIGRCGVAVHRRVPVLVQVNIAGEQQKAGLTPEDLIPFLRQYGEYPGLWIQGLMAVMPMAEQPEALRQYFREMRQRYDALQRQRIPGVEMHHLSMGMSADFIVAAEEGATMVRIGSAIFGSRA